MTAEQYPAHFKEISPRQAIIFTDKVDEIVRGLPNFGIIADDPSEIQPLTSEEEKAWIENITASATTTGGGEEIGLGQALSSRTKLRAGGKGRFKIDDKQVEVSAEHDIYETTDGTAQEFTVSSWAVRVREPAEDHSSYESYLEKVFRINHGERIPVYTEREYRRDKSGPDDEENQWEAVPIQITPPAAKGEAPRTMEEIMEGVREHEEMQASLKDMLGEQHERRFDVARFGEVMALLDQADDSVLLDSSGPSKLEHPK